MGIRAHANSPISLCHCLPYYYAIGRILDFSILPYLYAIPPASLPYLYAVPPISLCHSSCISPISLCRSSHISMPFLPYLYAVPPISLCHTCLNALIFNVFLPRKILKTLKIIKNGAFTCKWHHEVALISINL